MLAFAVNEGWRNDNPVTGIKSYRLGTLDALRRSLEVEMPKEPAAERAKSRRPAAPRKRAYEVRDAAGYFEDVTDIKVPAEMLKLAEHIATANSIN